MHTLRKGLAFAASLTALCGAAHAQRSAPVTVQGPVEIDSSPTAPVLTYQDYKVIYPVICAFSDLVGGGTDENTGGSKDLVCELSVRGQTTIFVGVPAGYVMHITELYSETGKLDARISAPVGPAVNAGLSTIILRPGGPDDANPFFSSSTPIFVVPEGQTISIFRSSDSADARLQGYLVPISALPPLTTFSSVSAKQAAPPRNAVGTPPLAPVE